MPGCARKILILAAVACTGLPAGCATTPAGDGQGVRIDSDPPGAKCILVRRDETLATVLTPTWITVSGSAFPVKVSCSKPGYQDGWDFLESRDTSKLFPFAPSNPANTASATAFIYPSELHVWLTASAPTSGTVNAAADSIPTPSKPKTVLDLLHNIKLVAQSGSLLRRDFYGQANLLQWFGGSEVKTSSLSDRGVGGSILGFDELVSPTPFGNGTLPGMQIQFSWSERTGTGVESTFSLMLRSATDASFDKVVGVFGAAWRKAPLEPPSPHRVYEPVTRPHGGEVIVYTFRTSGALQIMRVEFNGDATVASIYIKGLTEG
jgi:hypothetical protein